MAGSELHDLLSQLARFCRANDLASSHVLECKSKLSEIDLSALDRFFGLFVYSAKRVGLLPLSPFVYSLFTMLILDNTDRTCFLAHPAILCERGLAGRRGQLQGLMPDSPSTPLFHHPANIWPSLQFPDKMTKSSKNLTTNCPAAPDPEDLIHMFGALLARLSNQTPP